MRTRNRPLIVGLVATWLFISFYSAVYVPKFWSGAASLWTIGLGYSFYYAWSRISRGSGQAGIVIVDDASPTYAKAAADISMALVGILSTLVLVGLDDILPLSK